MKLNFEDWSDLLFRLMFSSLFFGLGFEHLFQDETILKFMPDWVTYRRPISILCGLILLTGALSILLGFRIEQFAKILALFIFLVTLSVHGVALFRTPVDLPQEWKWLWEVFQRSNFVKNICLLGVCIHLINYTPGRLTVSNIIRYLRGND
tara:strand:- start:4416 stop:4868 length:453 start_codon:yes stop_codon:yes gene_type:complete